jgi:hypothetical protein
MSDFLHSLADAQAAVNSGNATPAQRQLVTYVDTQITQREDQAAGIPYQDQGHTDVPGAGATAGTATPALAQGTPGQDDAMAIIQGVLDQYGLGSLATWAWGLITQGLDANAVQLQLYQRPEFKTRFPAIEARQKAGLPPISPGDYVNYENQAQQLFNQYGLPSDFYSKEGGQAMVDKLISADVSINEAQTRLGDYAQAVYASNPAVVQQLQNLYGVTPGELTSFFIDPATALPIIQKRFASAQIAGQAQIAGYNPLTQQQAETLYNQGVTQTQAQQGFQQLGLERQLFSALPGQQGAAITPDQQMAAQFMGNADAARLIEMQRQQRLGAFAGGGQFASTTQRGLTGLGTEQAAQA